MMLVKVAPPDGMILKGGPFEDPFGAPPPSHTWDTGEDVLTASLRIRLEAEAIVWTREARNPNTLAERLAELATLVGENTQHGRGEVLRAIAAHGNTPWRLLVTWAAFQWEPLGSGSQLDHPWGLWLAPDALAELERRARDGVLPTGAIVEMLRHGATGLRAFGRRLALIRSQPATPMCPPGVVCSAPADMPLVIVPGVPCEPVVVSRVRISLGFGPATASRYGALSSLESMVPSA